MNPQQALIERALITRIEHLERELEARGVYGEAAAKAWSELYLLVFPEANDSDQTLDFPAIRTLTEELKRRGLTSGGKAGE